MISLLQIRNCLVLGGSGVISPVLVPYALPSLSMNRERKLTWNEVKNSDFTTRVNHWYTNFVTLPTPLNKVQCLVSEAEMLFSSQ